MITLTPTRLRPDWPVRPLTCTQKNPHPGEQVGVLAGQGRGHSEMTPGWPVTIPNWDDANKIKEWGEKHEHRPVAWWPYPGDTALQPLCCVWIYIVKFYLPTYSLDYKSIKQRKRVTAISPYRMVACRWSCGVNISDRLSGMSDGDVCIWPNPGVLGSAYTSTLQCLVWA